MRATASLCVWALLTLPAWGEDGPLIIPLDRSSPAIHLPIGRSSVAVEPAFEDYAYMMFDVCDAMSFNDEQCNIFPMNGDLGGNAVATIFDGDRMIVYDRTLSSIVGYDGAVMIIAHEVGHHFCGHLGSRSHPRQELAADRFAGAAAKNMGLSLEQAFSAVPILSERPSRSHPGRPDRVEAIRQGWDDPN